MQRFAALFPNAFTIVMASGIIAIDALRLGHAAIGLALFAIAIAAWLLLFAAGLVRAVLEGRGLGRALTQHESGPGFLALVAGTAILGSLFAAFGVAAWAATPLFALATLLWWITQYGLLAGVTERRAKPPLETGLSGQWLLLVVATQALASLGADIAARAPSLAFICYAWVLLGGVYYLLLSAMVLYRFAFVAMPPEDITGPWWINGGAAAITVLAAGKLMSSGLSVGAFRLHDLLAPLIVAFWADATFWIPLLLLLFAWKHLIRRRPFRYSIAQWSVVFPLGMYCAGTLELETAFGLGLLHPLAHIAFWVAFLAWCAASAGALRAVMRPGGTPRPGPG
ncbi:MAG: tellurite resistance/C4-dicarboxylate transporter family protein [Acetobacteraceae bacterium]